MKQSSIDEIMVVLDRVAGALDVKIAAGRMDSLAEALAYLGPIAHQFGLTNYAQLPEFVENLAAPVLQLLQDPIAPALASPALDLGAGSGAVGITLAVLCPELEVVLADRRSRVVQFIDLCCRRLQLANCRTLQADLAAPPPVWQNRCRLVLVRAFGPTGQALLNASGLLEKGGSVALWHQPPSPTPPASLRAMQSASTLVPSLALTIYQKAD